MNITTKFNVGDKAKYKFTVTTNVPIPCKGNCVGGKVNAKWSDHSFPVTCPVCGGSPAFDTSKAEDSAIVTITSVKFDTNPDSYFRGTDNISYGFTGCRNANVAGESKLEAIA